MILTWKSITFLRPRHRYTVTQRQNTGCLGKGRLARSDKPPPPPLWSRQLDTSRPNNKKYTGQVTMQEPAASARVSGGPGRPRPAARWRCKVGQAQVCMAVCKMSMRALTRQRVRESILLGGSREQSSQSVSHRQTELPAPLPFPLCRPCTHSLTLSLLH